MAGRACGVALAERRAGGLGFPNGNGERRFRSSPTLANPARVGHPQPFDFAQGKLKPKPGWTGVPRKYGKRQARLPASAMAHETPPSSANPGRKDGATLVGFR